MSVKSRITGSTMSHPCNIFVKILEDNFDLDKSVRPFLDTMGLLNNKPPEYFICMALEELKLYLEQEPEDIEPDDNDGLERMLGKRGTH